MQTTLAILQLPSPWRTGWTTVVIFIVKNLLSRDDIVSLVTNVELYFTQMFILHGIFFRVEVPFKATCGQKRNELLTAVYDNSLEVNILKLLTKSTPLNLTPFVSLINR